MGVLAAMVFEACISLVIPNPFTINSLTEEQKNVIYLYAEDKCNREVDIYLEPFNQEVVNSCKESKLGECM